MKKTVLSNSIAATQSPELNQAVSQKELLERLMQTSAALLSGRTREEVLQIILRGVHESGFDRVRLFLLSPDERTLTGVAQLGMEEEKFDGASWLAADDYHFQLMLEEPLPYIFPNQPEHLDPNRERFGKADLEEWATVPLILRNRIIGHLAADNKFTRRKIQEADLAPLAIFGMQAAAVIEKADLSARDEKKLELFAKLAQATTKIVGQIGKLDLHELLTLVSKHACEILAAEVCSVFLRKREGFLTLEAGYGHLPGSFNQDLELAIRTGIKTGFTGHIAYEGQLINLSGEALRTHPAIRIQENTFSPSGHCSSVLALPMKQQIGQQEKLVGLLRADNKKDESGQVRSSLIFTQEDEWILRIFAEIIVVCLESARLVEHKKLLIGNLPQAAIAIDRRGNVTEFNHQAEEILGYKACEVLGKKVSQLYYNPDEPKLIGAALDKNTNGALSGYLTMIRSKAGQPVPISLSCYWLYDHHQRSGSVGIFEDQRRLHDYKSQLELTLQAIRTLADAETLESGLQRLAELLVALFPSTFCGVLLFDESQSVLVGQAAAYGEVLTGWPPSQSFKPRRFSVNDFPGLAELLSKGRPIRFTSQGHLMIQKNLAKINKKYGFTPPIQSLLVLPLKFGDRVLGVLDLAEVCDEEQSQFSEQHPENVELVAAIATQSAVFIDRMLIAERGRTQLVSFYESSSKLLAQKNPETLLLEAVKETHKAAGALSVDLVLIDEYGRASTVISVPDDPNRKKKVREDGVSMRVFRSGTRVQYSDIDEWSEGLNPELVEFAKAAICLPLSLPYKRIGVMWLHYAKPRHFSEQEVFALQLYVNQAAIAFESAQEEKRQQQLRETAASLVGEAELDKVRRQILRSTREFLKADGAIFGFFDHLNSTFVRRLSEADDGIAPDIWEKYRARGGKEHVTAERLLAEGPVFISDVEDEQQNSVLDLATRESLKQLGIKSFIAVPLRVGNERLGLVCALYQKPCSFDEREQRIASSFARYAALAVKKAKLFEQVKKTSEAATAVAKITVLGDRQATLDAIVEEVSNVTACDAVVLFEYDHEKRRVLKPTVFGLTYKDRALSDDEEKDYGLVYDLLNADVPFQVVQVASHSLYKNRRFAIDEKIATCVPLPLQISGKRIGVLFVNFRYHRHITTEELKAMQLFANQAALAIHYAQSTEGNERKLNELEALERLSDKLRQSQSLQEMMDCTTELTVRELGIEHCNLILPDRNGDLCLRSQFGWYPALESFKLGAGIESQAGITIATKKPVLVNDYATETRFKVIDHLRERRIKSGLSVPMFRDNQVVGALLVFTTKQRQFTDDEVRFFGLIANDSAMAMRGMERYEDLLRRDRHLGAVHNSSQAILENFGNEQQVFEQVVKEAVESLSGINEPKAVMGTLQFYDAERNELEMHGIYPPESLSLLLARVDKGRWSLDKTKAIYGKIGVTGRAIHEGRSQLVGDLSQDPDYIQYNEDSKSELSVPLKSGSKIIGAINVESDKLDGFDEYDKFALEALADHAVIAMQIAKTHKELRDTKGLVGTRTALAWMGLANNAWRHTIAGDAAELANRITLIREFLKQDEITNADIHRHLAKIELLAKSIQERPVTPPLSSEEGVAPTNLNELVTERLRQLRQNDRYDGVKLVAKVQPGTPLLVSVSSEWLRRALDILIDNAVRAVRSLTPSDPAHYVVTVSTALNGQKVELRVKDRGPGIPDEIQNKLFTGKIESSRGQGVGLLIAQAIVETYGGKIEVAKTDSEGTEMLIWLSHQP